jgi:hypothetical protein
VRRLSMAGERNRGAKFRTFGQCIELCTDEGALHSVKASNCIDALFSLMQTKAAD